MSIAWKPTKIALYSFSKSWETGAYSKTEKSTKFAKKSKNLNKKGTKYVSE